MMIITELVKRSRQAQAIINDYTQAQIDELILAIAWQIIKPEHNQYLSKLAIETTGLGNIDSKISKNRRKTMGLLRDLQNVKTVGVIAKYPDKGLIEIARPIGVIAAVVPSTNPIATPLNKIINAIKCRNSIILAPSPKGEIVCREMVNLIQQALKLVNAPIDIVQKLPAPIEKESTNMLCEQVDLVVATGSQNNILRAQQTGTPTLGVGIGNVPVIIDESADIPDAAQKIAASKTFDNATSCSSENSVVIVDKVYDETIAALTKVGGVLLNDREKQQLQNIMWDKQSTINPNIIAQSATKITQMAALTAPKFTQAQFLLVAESGMGKAFPFSREKLSPVLTVYRAQNFIDAAEISKRILQNQGQGHSCGIHTNNKEHIMFLGEYLPVCRVIVNQAHCFAAGGSFDNGMPFSLSMGCGSWGNNIIDDNLHYKHYLNITKIIETIKPVEPTEQEIFGSYWDKYDHQ